MLRSFEVNVRQEADARDQGYYRGGKSVLNSYNASSSFCLIVNLKNTLLS